MMTRNEIVLKERIVKRATDPTFTAQVIYKTRLDLATKNLLRTYSYFDAADNLEIICRNCGEAIYKWKKAYEAHIMASYTHHSDYPGNVSISREDILQEKLINLKNSEMHARLRLKQAGDDIHNLKQMLKHNK